MVLPLLPTSTFIPLSITAAGGEFAHGCMVEISEKIGVCNRGMFFGSVFVGGARAADDGAVV